MLAKLAASIKSSFLGNGERTEGLAYLDPAFGAEMAVEKQFGHWLPYYAYIEADKVFVNRDSIGFCLEVLPQSGADQRMTEILTSMYATCPVGTGVQFHLFGSPHIKEILLRYADLRIEDKDARDKAESRARPARNENMYRALARRRFGYLLKGSQHSLTRGFHYTLKDFRLLLSVNIPGDIDDLSRREQLLSLREAMATTLRAANFPSRPASASDLINWCADICNPHRLVEDAPQLVYDPGRELRDQIIYADTVQTPCAAGLLFEKPDSERVMEVRFYSVKSFPERYGLWQMGGLIGDLMQGALQYSSPFMITMGVEVVDPDAMKTAVLANQTRATQNAQSKMAILMPDIPKKKKDWDMAADTIDAGGRMIHLYHELAVFTDHENAVAAEETAKSIWRSRGFEINNDVFMHRQSLLASLPMTLSQKFYSDLKRMRRVTTKTIANAIHLAPLLAEWGGTQTPVLLFGGRRGQPMSFDLYDMSDLGNYNFAVIGTSGSGKSVFLNELAWSYLSVGSKVWMIDLGRSFEKLCRKANGQYLEFRPNVDLVLNPFTTVQDINEDMAILHPTLAKMASMTQPLEEFQYKAIQSAILQRWHEYGQEMTITAVRDLFKTGRLRDYNDEPDQRLKDLAVMLEPYTKDGVYARFFEGRSNVNFDNDFIVIENEELKRRPELHLVINMLNLYRITQDMYLARQRGDHRRKLLIIDELKQQLGNLNKEDSLMAQVIEEAARRARKYGGALGTATQGADDYYSSAALTAAFNFSDWVFMLRQKRESIEMLDRSGRMLMDESKKRLLGSLRTESGVYSEIYIYSELGEGVARLILDPHTLLLFSNRSEDNAAIDQRRSMGMSVDEAISDVLRERGIAA